MLVAGCPSRAVPEELPGARLRVAGGAGAVPGERLIGERGFLRVPCSAGGARSFSLLVSSFCIAAAPLAPVASPGVCVAKGWLAPLPGRGAGPSCLLSHFHLYDTSLLQSLWAFSNTGCDAVRATGMSRGIWGGWPTPASISKMEILTKYELIRGQCRGMSHHRAPKLVIGARSASRHPPCGK